MPQKASAPDAPDAPQDDGPPPDPDAPVWTPESFAPAPGQPPQLWPCWRWAFALWQAMRTQWRTAGMAGAFIGLDYSALDNVERRIGLPQAEQRQAFAGLQVFEFAQLAQWREDEKAQAMKDKHG